MFEYHVHSHFSDDCSVPMEEMVQGAIQKGLRKICFTDHIDFDYPDPLYTFDLDLDGYFKELSRLQKIYETDIEIYKGIEVGIQPHLPERYEAFLAQKEFDFIICSLHTVDKADLHSGELFNSRSIEASYQKYYEELLYCVKNFDKYQILGHLDLVKRYTIGQQVNTDFHDTITQIFQTIIPQGKGIEINTSGTRYGMKNALPSKDILQLYKDLGGEIITIGADAHRVEDINYHFKESLQLLDELGFTYVCSFSKQKPTFHKINDLL